MTQQRVHHAKYQADESQVEIKIAGRNSKNKRYTDDITLMVESEEELKNLLMRVKEKSEEAGLKLNIQKMKIMASGPISSVQFSSVTQLCPTFCDPHELQHARPPCPSPTPRVTHVHWVGDTIQPSHPQSSPSPPTFNLSQHQGPF